MTRFRIAGHDFRAWRSPRRGWWLACWRHGCPHRIWFSTLADVRRFAHQQFGGLTADGLDRRTV